MSQQPRTHHNRLSDEMYLPEKCHCSVIEKLFLGVFLILPVVGRLWVTPSAATGGRTMMVLHDEGAVRFVGDSTGSHFPHYCILKTDVGHGKTVDVCKGINIINEADAEVGNSTS